MKGADRHPDFFIVGVVKGGTTSLHHYLDQHPEIYMSPVKETNFFSRHDINPAHFSTAYRHDVDVDLKKYLQGNMAQRIHIAHVTDPDDYAKLFRNAGNAKAVGEASNSYMLYPRAPQLIRETFPDARIIMMLRNPVERAYSQYIMNLRLGKTLETDFLHEIREDDSREIRGWGANHQYLYIGKYYQQVKRILDLFPREQVLILWYDDYRDDPMATVRTIYRFLGVDEHFEPDTEEKLNTAGVPRFRKMNYWINQSGVISWAKRRLPQSWRGPFKRWMYSGERERIPAMTEEERRWLIDYYRTDILALSELVGRDLGHWLD